MTSARVAVIGLGVMGAALAAALLRSGAEVRVWNRTSNKAAALHDQGAIACGTPRDAISESAFVVVCLSDYPAWRSLSDEQDLGQTLADRTVIQLTTGTLEQVREHEIWIGQCGGRLIDGSIMCFPSAIGTDQASLLVAGARAVFDSCRDILIAISPNHSYLDHNIVAPVILARALISGVLGTLVGTINGVALCRAGGVSLSHFIEHTGKNNPVVADEALRICKAIQSGDTVTTEAALKTWAEGQSALLELARTLGTRPEFQAALQFLFQRAMDSGIGDHDLSALVEVFAGEVELHPNDGS
jgi:3-hydroxyisobutyrate dehydrogenase-like beta-hydroxyacid dehydrogenase